MSLKSKKQAAEKRAKKEKIFELYLDALDELKQKKLAYQQVADECNVTARTVKELVLRYQPKSGTPLRMHGNNRLDYEQESLVVGLILGMANISKPLNVSSLLKILQKLSVKLDEFHYNSQIVWIGPPHRY